MIQATGRAEKSRSRLLAAASDALIAGDGSFELQDIALRAGVSVGLVAHHFGSKAGLIGAVVNRFYDRAGLALDLGEFRPRGWSAREKERMSRLIAFFYHEALAAIILSRLAHYPEIAAIEAERWNGLVEAAARNIIKGQARGQISDSQRPDILAAMIVGAARQAIVQALAAVQRPTEAQLCAAIWGFITTGLRLSAAADTVVAFKATAKDNQNERGTQ